MMLELMTEWQQVVQVKPMRKLALRVLVTVVVRDEQVVELKGMKGDLEAGTELLDEHISRNEENIRDFLPGYHVFRS